MRHSSWGRPPGPPPVALATWALALSDMGAGRWSEATTRLAAVASPHSPQSHPVVALLAASDLVEAAPRRPGRPAGEALARLETFAGPTAAAWTLALVARSRALLAPDAGAAEGVTRRRSPGTPRRSAASTRPGPGCSTASYCAAPAAAPTRDPSARRARHLRAVGAEPWADRARAELRATGETARRHEPRR